MSKVREKQRRRRTEILEKVMDLLKNKPFEQITVQDICQASDISVGSFYHYFNQKSELIVGLMGLIDLYMVEHVFPLLKEDGVYENLKILSRGFASYVEETGIEISKLISKSNPTEYGLHHDESPLYVKLVGIISDGQEKGVLKKELGPKRTAELLLVALSGVAVDWSRREGSYSIIKCMDEFTDLFFPALLSSEKLK